MATPTLSTSVPVWSSDTEIVLDRIRLNAYNMSEIHRRQFLHLKGLANYFDIPVIVLSAVNTIMSVGVQPYLSQGTISISTCVISAFSGIIVSIKLYLAIQSQMEIELTTCKELYNLSVDIYKTISLDVPNRGVDGITYLNECFQRYSDLVQKSSVLNKNLKDKMAPEHISVIPVPAPYPAPASSHFPFYFPSLFHYPSHPLFDLSLNRVPAVSSPSSTLIADPTTPPLPDKSPTEEVSENNMRSKMISDLYGSTPIKNLFSTIIQKDTYDIENGENKHAEETTNDPIPPPVD